MGYIASNNINVAPAVKRSTTRPEARIMSEQLLVGIINKLVDRPSFVITKEFVDSSPFAFNIYGYYFEVTQGQYITGAVESEATDIYAIINITDGTHFAELDGQDENDEYKGLTLTSAKPNNTTYSYNLHLLTRTSTGQPWYIPEDSLIKFEESSLDVSVDGGEIS